LRVTLSAAHSEAQLDRLLNALARCRSLLPEQTVQEPVAV
jgi:8-amino-7-oxononanoate synthase